MAREANKIETVGVQIRTTPKVIEYLDILLDEQLYGKSRSEVAEQLVRLSIQNLIDKDHLTKIPKS